MAPVASKKSPVSLLSSWNPTLSYTFLEWVVEEEDNCCAYKAFSNVMRYRKTVDSGSFNFPSSPVFNGFQMLARQFRGSKEIRGIQWKAVKLQTSWDLFIFSIHPSNPIQIPCACHVLIPVETLINKSCGLPGGNARLMRKKKGRGKESGEERRNEYEHKSLSMNNCYHNMGLEYLLSVRFQKLC